MHSHERRRQAPDDIRAFERLLREAGGFSRSEATFIARHGWITFERKRRISARF